MNEHDAMRLLAAANPVRIDDLADLGEPQFFARSPRRRLVLAVAVVAAALAASLIGAFAFRQSAPSMYPGLKQGLGGPVLPPPPRTIALSDLSLAVGAPVALPATSLVRPADAQSASAGWGCPAITTEVDGTCVVTVEIPSQSLTIQYSRPTGQPGPAGFAADTQQMQKEAAAHPGSGRADLLDLDGVPAMFGTGDYSLGAEGTASIHFIVGETGVTIYGKHDEATLESLAQSVVSRTPAPIQTTLPDASGALGAPVVLPETGLVGRSDATPTVATSCPTATDGGVPCQVTVEFPSLAVSYVPLTIRYLRPAPADPSTAYESVVKQVKGSKIVSLDVVPALFVPGLPGAQPGWIEFVANGTDVTVQGIYDEATLKAIAQSILDPVRQPSGTNVIPAGSWSVQRIRLRDASAYLGGPVPLPAASLARRAEATAIGNCPPRAGRPSQYGCSIEVALAGTPRTLVYERASTLWRPTPDTRLFRLDGVRAAEFRATRLSVKPAIWVVTFVIEGTRVQASGRRTFVHGLAKSIIDHSR